MDVRNGSRRAQAVVVNSTPGGIIPCEHVAVVTGFKLQIVFKGH